MGWGKVVAYRNMEIGSKLDDGTEIVECPKCGLPAKPLYLRNLSEYAHYLRQQSNGVWYSGWHDKCIIRSMDEDE